MKLLIFIAIAILATSCRLKERNDFLFVEGETIGGKSVCLISKNGDTIMRQTFEKPGELSYEEIRYSKNHSIRRWYKNHGGISQWEEQKFDTVFKTYFYDPEKWGIYSKKGEIEVKYDIDYFRNNKIRRILEYQPYPNEDTLVKKWVIQGEGTSILSRSPYWKPINKSEKTYYENGQLEEEKYFDKLGKPIGIWRKYDAAGNILEEKSF